MRSCRKAFSQLVINEGDMVGGAIPELVVLDFIRKQAEQARGKQASKQHSSIASASASISVILLCLSFCPDFLQ